MPDLVGLTTFAPYATSCTQAPAALDRRYAQRTCQIGLAGGKFVVKATIGDNQATPPTTQGREGGIALPAFSDSRARAAQLVAYVGRG